LIENFDQKNSLQFPSCTTLKTKTKDKKKEQKKIPIIQSLQNQVKRSHFHYICIYHIRSQPIKSNKYPKQSTQENKHSTTQLVEINLSI